MSTGEIITGFGALIFGVFIVTLALLDQLPNDPIATLLRVSPMRIRARGLLIGIGFVLLGLFMIVQGFGFLR